MLALLMSLMACDLPLEGHSCNLMYSPSTLTLELTADWSGEISVDVSGDDAQFSCVLSEDEAAAECDDFHGSIELSDDLLVVVLSEFSPAVVELTVVHDGGSESLVLEPEYTVDEPNGPGCGERSIATESLTL